MSTSGMSAIASPLGISSPGSHGYHPPPSPPLDMELHVMLDDLKLRLGGLVARIRTETWKSVGMGIDDHEGLVSNLP